MHVWVSKVGSSHYQTIRFFQQRYIPQSFLFDMWQHIGHTQPHQNNINFEENSLVPEVKVGLQGNGSARCVATAGQVKRQLPVHRESTCLQWVKYSNCQKRAYHKAHVLIYMRRDSEFCHRVRFCILYFRAQLFRHRCARVVNAKSKSRLLISSSWPKINFCFFAW